MGGWELNSEDRNVRLFNSPIEIGLRCLFLLYQFRNDHLSIDKLIYLDYFLIHAGDVSKEQKSIHPKYPFRSTEIVVKREILSSALKLLISKELININFADTGIQYEITNVGCKALDYFESNYANQIRKVSDWLYQTYKDFTEAQLSEVIDTNLQKWGSEFSNESKFRTLFE
jgi:hypothetical protein